MGKNRCSKNKIKLLIIIGKGKFVRTDFPFFVVIFIVNIHIIKMEIRIPRSNIVYTPCNSSFVDVKTVIIALILDKGPAEGKGGVGAGPALSRRG